MTLPGHQVFVLLYIMKKLYLVRHAKSSWDDYTLMDEERPLNERGKRDAPAMAELLKEKESDIQFMITSTAKRARATAKVFRKVLGLSKDRVLKSERLYLASPSGILDVLHGLEDVYDTVAIFGHNPGLTDFVNRFSDQLVDNVPTCGIARIDFDVDSWREIQDEEGDLTAFYYPKMPGLL